MYRARMVTDCFPHVRFRVAITLTATVLLANCAQPTNTSVIEPTSTGQSEITLPRGDVVAKAELRTKLAMLSPTVRVDEAERLAQCAYITSRRLAREYRVVFPPALNNILVNTGARKRGLCYQWTEDLMHELDALKLETLELHWGEAFARTFSENNGVVVTAKGQPFAQGIVLDAWRYQGRLYWGPVRKDPEGYKWQENKAQYDRVMNAEAAQQTVGLINRE
jgi:hypothetical protein